MNTPQTRPKPTPRVTMGAVQPLGIPADELARARSGGMGLAPAIQAALLMAHRPTSDTAPVQAATNQAVAPSELATALNIVFSNMAAPLSSRMAAAGTDGALDQRSYAPGADLSRESSVYGGAASAGAVGGLAAIAHRFAPEGAPGAPEPVMEPESSSDQVRREFFEKLSPAEQKYVRNDPTVRPIFEHAITPKTSRLAAALVPYLTPTPSQRPR